MNEYILDPAVDPFSPFCSSFNRDSQHYNILLHHPYKDDNYFCNSNNNSNKIKKNDSPPTFWPIPSNPACRGGISNYGDGTTTTASSVDSSLHNYRRSHRTPLSSRNAPPPMTTTKPALFLPLLSMSSTSSSASSSSFLPLSSHSPSPPTAFQPSLLLPLSVAPVSVSTGGTSNNSVRPPHSFPTPPPPPPGRNYKTEFCNKFRVSGVCPYGDQCQFVHHFQELQLRRGRALTYKTQPCWSGDQCRYYKRQVKGQVVVHGRVEDEEQEQELAGSNHGHARCIYLHGSETPEMFDTQRGISYARVEQIMKMKKRGGDGGGGGGNSRGEMKKRKKKKSKTDDGREKSFRLSDTISAAPGNYPKVPVISRAVGTLPSISLLPHHSRYDAFGFDVVDDDDSGQGEELDGSFKPASELQLSLKQQNRPSNDELLSLPMSPEILPVFEISEMIAQGRLNEWSDPCFNDDDGNGKDDSVLLQLQLDL